LSRRFEPLVLCYHAVSDGWEHALSIGPAAFERQLRLLLRARWRPATVEQAAAGRGRLLHVTFDDAYTSVARALPLLERLRVPATVFACSGYADEGRPLAVPELAADAAAQPDELRTMAWDELRELAERGVAVGSHTVSHPHLTAIDDGALARELRESRERLEDELRRPCPYLAYPYGEQDARVRAAAEAAGYDAAFGLPGQEQPIDRFQLPRVGLYRRDGLARLAVKTTGVVRRPLARLTGRAA